MKASILRYIFSVKTKKEESKLSSRENHAIPSLRRKVKDLRFIS